MNKQTALTYSLLAHIRTTSTLVKGPLDIFVPLIKRVLSKMNEDGIFSGKSISEIKKYSDDLYEIDFPIPVIEKILKKIANEINTAEKSYFKLYQDKAFAINGYFFTEFEENVRKHKIEIENLEKLFKKFKETSEINKVEENSIFRFIEKNKHSLSRYLSANQPDRIEDFSAEAQFVKFFQHITPVYELIKEIYLGSILAGYIEFEPKEVNMEVELLLDTNFVIGLLDLNTPESTHTCRTLLEIANSQGYKCKILSDTIEEIQALLEAKSNFFNQSFLQKKVNPEDIYNACERRKLNSADLERISDNLKDELNSFKIYTIYDTRKLKNKAKLSEEYKFLKPRRNTPKAALHDAAAIIYVKDKRGKDSYSFDKVNCWFVNNAINRDNQQIYTPNGKRQPEIIKADDLLNILWLSNPQSKVSITDDQIVDIGLSSLISLTLNQSIPKASIIRELDDNIHKYADKKINDTDIVRIATRITSNQIKNIDELNSLAENNKKEFVKRLQQEADRQKETESKRMKMLDDAVENFKKKTSNIEVVKEEYNEDIQSKKSQINSLTEANSKKDDEIKKLKKQITKRENEGREELRDKFYNQKLSRWRLKSWVEFVLSILLLIFPLLYICYQSEWNLSKSITALKNLEENYWISLALTIAGIIFTKITLPTLLGKYRNHSNINSYKSNLKLPVNLKPIDSNNE